MSTYIELDHALVEIDKANDLAKKRATARNNKAYNDQYAKANKAVDMTIATGNATEDILLALGTGPVFGGGE